MQTFSAKLNNIRISHRKLVLVANLVRGMSVESSLAQMQFLTKRGAEPVAKLIKSAAANANHNYGVKSKNLIVKNIFVTQAATYKRGKAVSRGRYFRIMRRGSNLNIELAQI